MMEKIQLKVHIADPAEGSWLRAGWFANSLGSLVVHMRRVREALFFKCVVRGVGGVKASQDGLGHFFPRLPV